MHQPVEYVSSSLKLPYKIVLLDSTNKRLEIIACIVKMLTLYVSLTKIALSFIYFTNGGQFENAFNIEFKTSRK